MTTGAKRALTHSSIYALGNITRQLAGFIMLPIYTRHLSPTDYGVIGLLLAVQGLVELLFGARLAHAIPKFYFEETSEKGRHQVISTSLLLTGGVSFLSMLALIIWRGTSSELLFNSPDYGDVFGLFGTLILSQAIEYYSMTYIRMQERPWLFITASLTKLILQLSLNIYLVVFLKMGITGVAIGGAASSMLFALVLGGYTLRQTGLSFSKVHAWKMLKFSWPLWIGGFAGLYAGSAHRYFINLFSSTADVGLFELATKFSSILGLIIWEPFSQYWQSERFKIYQDINAKATYQTAFQTIAALLALGALGVGLFADPVILIMSAPPFHAASLAVPALTIGVMFGCFTYFSNFSFLAKEQTAWIARNDYVKAGILSVMLLSLTPIWGFAGAAVAGAITNIIQFLIVHHKGKRVYDMQITIAPLFGHLAILIVIFGASRLISTASIWVMIAANCGLFILGAAAIAGLTLRQPEIRTQATVLASMCINAIRRSQAPIK